LSQKRIKMIVPVPLPAEALKGFASQMPVGMIRADIDVEFAGVRNGTTTLDSFFEATMADAFCLEAGLRAEEEGFSAICLNSVSDSGLAALRSRLSIPVTGPGRASFFLAADLAKKFSVVTMWPQWHWIYEKLAMETGLGSRLASVRNIGIRPDTHELLAGKEAVVFDKLEEQCRIAIEQDGADAIILGSTTMHQSHKFLSERLDVPVLNPGLIAFKQCEMLLDLGLSHSKRTYHSPEAPADTVLAQVHSLF
jgi:allantoin racemase